MTDFLESNPYLNSLAWAIQHVRDGVDGRAALEIAIEAEAGKWAKHEAAKCERCQQRSGAAPVQGLTPPYPLDESKHSIVYKHRHPGHSSTEIGVSEHGDFVVIEAVALSPEHGTTAEIAIPWERTEDFLLGLQSAVAEAMRRKGVK